LGEIVFLTAAAFMLGPTRTTSASSAARASTPGISHSTAHDHIEIVTPWWSTVLAGNGGGGRRVAML